MLFLSNVDKAQVILLSSGLEEQPESVQFGGSLAIKQLAFKFVKNTQHKLALTQAMSSAIDKSATTEMYSPEC